MIVADFTKIAPKGYKSFLREAIWNKGCSNPTRAVPATITRVVQDNQVIVLQGETGRCISARVDLQDGQPIGVDAKVRVWIRHPVDAVETHVVGRIVELATGRWCERHESYSREEVMRHLSCCLARGVDSTSITLQTAVTQGDAVIVTRHPALQRYLRNMPALHDAPVVEHAAATDVLNKVVFGVLPLSLAHHAKFVVEYPMNIPAELRGKELDDKEFRKYVGMPSVYSVARW